MGDVPDELKKYRDEIDVCDRALVEALIRRFDVVRRVGEFKNNAQMDAVQPARAQAVKDQAIEWGVSQGLSDDFMRRLYDMVIDYAHEIEHEILDDATQDVRS